MCVYRSGLTNTVTATETEHQLLISIKMLHPHKDAGLRRKQSQGWSESVYWAERPENLWEEEVSRSWKITITWSHVLDQQSDVSSKAIVSNLCKSKTEKLALEFVSFPLHQRDRGSFMCGGRGQRTVGRWRSFSPRLREEEKGKAEGRQRGGPKGKRERGGIRVQTDWRTRQRGQRGVWEGFKINCMRRRIQSKSVEGKWLQWFFSPILNWLPSDWIHQINYFFFNDVWNVRKQMDNLTCKYTDPGNLYALIWTH